MGSKPTSSLVWNWHKISQHHPSRHSSLVPVLFLLLASCSPHLSDLPANSDSAFALRHMPRNDTTLMETFIVEATIPQIYQAAEEALISVDFTERRESWNNSRRCGEYTLSWYEWPFWACFYFKQMNSESVKIRVIVESWKNLGATTNQNWHLSLTTAFKNRIDMIRRTLP